MPSCEKHLLPIIKRYHFSQQQQKSPPKKQLRRIRNRPRRKKPENQHKMIEVQTQPKFEVAVRQREMKRPAYRFTYNESHMKTQVSKTQADGNFRLQIQSGDCRHDLLKLNRRKLEAMISKIHQDNFQLSGQPNSMAEVVLIKSQRRSALFKAEARKSYDWKAYPDRQTSPREFDTRDYLTCQAVKKYKWDTTRQSQGQVNADSNKSQMVESPEEKKKDNVKSGSFSRPSGVKYHKPLVYASCKTEEKLGSSQNIFDRSSNTKPETASFIAFNLKGWQYTCQRDSIFFQNQSFY